MIHMFAQWLLFFFILKILNPVEFLLRRNAIILRLIDVNVAELLKLNRW